MGVPWPQKLTSASWYCASTSPSAAFFFSVTKSSAVNGQQRAQAIRHIIKIRMGFKSFITRRARQYAFFFLQDKPQSSVPVG